MREAHCKPQPVPVPPMMIGGFKPKMLQLTAKYADWWNVSSTNPIRYRRMVEKLERYCLETGRDISTIRKTWVGGCACASTQGAAAALAVDRWVPEDEEDFGFVGTPHPLIEQVLPFIELGVDYFMFNCAGFPKLTTLEMLVEEVLPLLREYDVRR